MPAPRSLAPRVGMVFDVVHYLAVRHGVVAMRGEPTGNRYGVRSINARLACIVDEACRIIGIHSGEHTCTRSTAYRCIAEGVVEENSTLGEAVEVRSMDILNAIASHFGTQVVGHNEKHVHVLLICSFGMCRSSLH